ncbi:helix-turn-helix domain-containing protein [Brevibacillus porteri]|uniref:helix-turn-helix domain-containing protein n=1 Tax=Brevibacillus porteri TaxID=2126350 RepID=UPI00362D633B
MLDEYGEVLTVEDVQKFLKIGRVQAYDLVNSGQFHIIRVGRIIKVPKSAFLQWFKGKEHSEATINKNITPTIPEGAVLVTDKEDILFLERVSELSLKKKRMVYRVIYELLDLQD